MGAAKTATSTYGSATATQGRGQKTFEHHSTVTSESRTSGTRRGSVDILRDDVVGKIRLVSNK